MSLKFSLHSVHGGVKTIDEIHKRARRAEELGYDGIFTGESHLSSIDSFQTLATCAMITKRILLGIAVSNMVFRHPTVLAGAAASLNEISKGRAILGLGTGDGPVYSQGRKATPLAQFEPGVRMIRDLVQGKTVDFPTGKVGLGFNVRPVPIYVSAEDRNEARRIVRNRIANRAHHNFRFTLETVPPEELEGIKKFMVGFDVMKPMEDRVDPELVNEYLIHRFSIAGTPSECIERIEALRDAGVEHLMLTPARMVYHETGEAFATKVIPHFRKT
jgi:alkanesulfonate monooxygenase SsuD/methylene tetrahydromethanopterin reductase-like flavin-dependent oxidoreductase (luciferase family)